VIRTVFRAIGWVLLAIAGTVLSYDLVRWIIEGHASLTDTGLLWRSLDSDSLQLAEAAISRYLHPFLWHPVMVSILLTPAFVVFGVVALVLLFLTRGRGRGRKNHGPLFME
jgi:hypothetical protein